MIAATKYSASIQIWLAFTFLAIVTAAAMAYSVAAGCAIGLLTIAVLCAPRFLIPAVVSILVCVPIRGIFSAEAAELSSTAVLARNIESGDLPRQMAILSLSAIGCWLLIRIRFQLRHITALKCFGAYVALGVLSTLWSAEPMLTSRRVVAATGCTVFTAGLALGYYGRSRAGGARLVRDIAVIGSLACSLVIAVALVNGNFHLFDPGWRLGSVGRENQISWVAAIAFLAAFVTRDSREIWPAPLVVKAIWVLSGVVLLLSKSRTTLIAVALALTVSELFEGGVRRKVAVLAIVGCTMATIASSALFDRFWQRGGSEDQLESASGRTELWRVVRRDISAHPWLGYGYGAYWTADRVNRQEIEWAPTSAHSGYLETTAELGFAGVATLALFIAICARDAWRLFSLGPCHRDIARLLLAVTVSFIVINLTESYIDSIEYFPLLATLTLVFYVSDLAGKISCQPC